MVKPSYEEIRRQRVEENKKRMEDLNLTQLANILRTSSPKSASTKKANPKVLQQKQLEFVVVRRSSRVANKPPPNYKEGPVGVELVARPRRFSTRRNLSNRVYASDEARSYAIERAEEVQSGLEPQFPSFVKPMLQSHVTGGFWLGLPTHFCKMNLPKRDEDVILVDENEDEHRTLYLARKAGLSAGWRGFAISHDLVDGDALVFQQIQHTKFKVYIIRASGLEENDGAP